MADNETKSTRQEQEPDQFSYQSLRINKLKHDGSNYTAWRAQVDVLLDLQGLTGVVKEPEDQGGPRWTQRNREARTLLFMSCTDEVQITHLIGLETGASILKSLDEIYRPQGRKQRYQRRIRLHTLEWESHQSASQFVAAFKTAVRDAVEAGSVVDEESQICQLLHLSHAKFPTWTNVKLASWTDASPLHINALCNELMDIAVSTDLPVALTAKPETLICSYCKKEGHDVKFCWKLHPEQIPQWVRDRQTSTIAVLAL
jgi:hypothetical protein